MKRHIIRPRIAIGILLTIIIVQAFKACDKSDPLSSNAPVATLTFNTIEHDGLEREYFLYVPESYSGDDPVPLVFNFHGYTQEAVDYMDYSDFRPIADTANFIIVYPQGTLFNGLAHWNVGGAWTIGSTVDDVGFTETLIDIISSEYSINQSKVFSTGYSNGGYLSFHLACKLNHKITAIAPVAATMTPSTFGDCTPQHATPILQIHGTNDILVPYIGSLISLSVKKVLEYWINYNNCKPTPIITNIEHDDKTINGTTVEQIVYSGGDNNAVVKHYKINKGGHDWPGSSGNMDINATDEIWKFFSKY